MSESYPATAESVPVARRAVTDYAALAGLSQEQLDGLRLAVSEAVTNVVIHAYPETGGEVHITAAVTGDELWVLVSDDGVGFQTPSQTPGLGVGLALIADAAHEFTVSERGGGGTEARMQFSLRDPSAAA